MPVAVGSVKMAQGSSGFPGLQGVSKVWLEGSNDLNDVRQWVLVAELTFDNSISQVMVPSTVSRVTPPYSPLLQARNASGGEYVEWWFESAERSVLPPAPAHAELLRHVPWGIVCAAVSAAGGESYTGVAMHSGLERNNNAAKPVARNFSGSGAVDHSSLVISVGGRGISSWEVAEVAVWDHALSYAHLSEVVTYYHETFSLPSGHSWRRNWGALPRAMTTAAIHDTQYGIMYCAAAVALPCMAPSGRVCSAGETGSHAQHILGVDARLLSVYHPQIVGDTAAGCRAVMICSGCACTGADVPSWQGSFSDGSGAQNYSNGVTCQVVLSLARSLGSCARSHPSHLSLTASRARSISQCNCMAWVRLAVISS